MPRSFMASARAVKPTAGQKPSRAAANRPSAPIAERFHGRKWVGKRTIQAASNATATSDIVIGLKRGWGEEVGGSSVTDGLRIRERILIGVKVRPGGV